jgi:hypothetical protein
MSPHTLPHALRRLEGRHVSVALRDGTRLDDCELVSVARRRRGGTLWLLVGDDDHIVAVDDVLAVDSLPVPVAPVGRYPPG